MILTIEGKQTCMDIGMAVEYVNKNINNWRNRLELIKQLYNIKSISKYTYDFYILTPLNNGIIEDLKKEGYFKILMHVIKYHFSGTWGGEFKELDNNIIECMSYKD